MDKPPITPDDMPKDFFEIGKTLVDPLVVSLQHDAHDLQTALDDGTLTGEEAREFLADVNERYRELLGENVIAHGAFTANIGDESIFVTSIPQTIGCFGGVMLEPELRADATLGYGVKYRIDIASDMDSEMPHGMFDHTTHLDFTDFVSVERARSILDEFELLDDIDSALLNSETLPDMIEVLAKIPFTTRESVLDTARTYGLVARYMTAISGIHHGVGLTCELTGDIYDLHKDWHKASIHDRGVLVDATFAFNLSDAAHPELCLAGTLTRRGYSGALCKVAIPLASLRSVSEITRLD